MTVLLDAPSAHEPVEPATRPAPRTFRPDIEGLRAVAVLAVLAYHAGIPGFSGGYVGVDVFFVVSGFLITGLLLREHERTGAVSISGFYARRARRILPAASVVLVAVVSAVSVLLGQASADATARDGLWTSVFAANFRFMSVGADYLNATAAPSPLQHFWSLAVEEQFYLVWPLLLWLVLALAARSATRMRVVVPVATAAVVVLSFAWCVHLTTSDANAAYFSPFTRAWELGLGALVAVAAPSLTRLPSGARLVAGWVGVAAIVVAVVTFDATTAFPGAAAALPVVGAAGVVVAGLRAEPRGAETVLGRRPLQWVGRLSYSLYLWHWPLLTIAAARHPDPGLLLRVGLLVAAFVLSWLSFRFVEQPLRRNAKLAASRILTLSVALVTIGAVAAYCGMFVVSGRYADARAERQFAAQTAQAATATVATEADVRAAVAAAAGSSYASPTLTPPASIAARDFSPAYSDGCLVEAAETTSPTCTFGDPTASTTVVLFGDSHAAQWLTALENVATRVPFKLVVLTKGNCPVPSLTVYNLGLKRPFTECTTWRDNAIDRIDRLKPALVVMASTFHGASLGAGMQTGAVQAAWLAGMRQTFTRLQASGARQVVVGDVPAHTQAVPACVTANPHALSRCAEPRLRGVLNDYQSAEQRTVRGAGVGYVDAVPWFCTDAVCPGVVNGIVTEFDDSHLTTTYSKYLGHVLGRALGLETA